MRKGGYCKHNMLRHALNRVKLRGIDCQRPMIHRAVDGRRSSKPGPVHTDAFSFEDASFWMRLRLSYTLQRCAFSSKTHNLKTLSRVETFENGAFRKRSQTKRH